MPLKKGNSKKVVSENMAKLINEGFDKDQAYVIAMKNAGKERYLNRKNRGGKKRT